MEDRNTSRDLVHSALALAYSLIGVASLSDDTRYPAIAESHARRLASVLRDASGHFYGTPGVREALIGHYANPPEPVSGISAACWHEMGLKLAQAVHFGVCKAADPRQWTEVVAGILDSFDATRIAENWGSVREWLRSESPQFDVHTIVSHIDHEAALAARSSGDDGGATWPTSRSREASTEDRGDVSPMMSSNDLARKHGVPHDSLRKRLERWRIEHDSGYTEASNVKPNEPRFLYCEADVMSVIKNLRAKQAANKRPTNVQPKKT